MNNLIKLNKLIQCGYTAGSQSHLKSHKERKHDGKKNFYVFYSLLNINYVFIGIYQIFLINDLMVINCFLGHLKSS